MQQRGWDHCLSSTPTRSTFQSSKVLVIYAGGTIGMFKDNAAGYTTGDRKGYLQRVCESNPIFHSPSTTNNGCRAPVAALGTPLVMPPSIFGKTIIYQILEYSPLLDSSNMTVEDWIKIANDIQTYYHHFDGFVVLHGTDTMAYTASALSFMLENLGKSVILTGSQIPLSELRNDATSNFLGAMTIAGHYIIPEVTLFFCNKLFRGNRAVKSNLSSFDAFESANHKPLATVGINIEIDWPQVWRSPEAKVFCARKTMNPNVTCLRLFPGITEATVRAILSPAVEGVVLETFGAGNAPDNRPDLLLAIKEATDRGCVIVNISQCRQGIVSDLYATGKALTRAGVVPGMDMTTECALTKLSYLLGMTELPKDEIRLLVGQNLRGELTRPTFQHIHGAGFKAASTLSETFLSILQSTLPSNRAHVDMLLASHFFHMAASMNDIGCMERLLVDRASQAIFVDSMDYTDRTALNMAVSHGAFDSVKWLISHGASVHSTDIEGKTVLVEAIEMAARNPDRSVYLEIAQFLYNVGARIPQDYLEQTQQHSQRTQELFSHFSK